MLSAAGRHGVQVCRLGDGRWRAGRRGARCGGRCGDDRPDRGSILLLLPACLLVMFVLASIALDLSLVHLRQRQALDVAASAANDAVTAGASTAALRAGTYRVDPAEAQDVVARTVAASRLAPHLVGPPRVRVDDATVEVSLTVDVDYLFTATMPGAPDATTVTAKASATALTPQ